MNQLTTEVKTHWVITHKDSHHHITAEQERRLADIGLDDLINIDGNSIKGSSIAEVLTNEAYRHTYPDKKPSDTHQRYNPAPQSFEDIVEKYAWATTAYKFPDMMTLVALTQKKLDAWTGTFENFCIKHKAITSNGDTIPSKYTDEKGEHSAVFAYPFFMDVQRLIEARKRKASYAEEQSWGDIIQGKLTDQPIDERSFTEKMSDWYDRNPTKKDGAGYKFFSEHSKGKYKQVKSYKPKFQTLEEYNSHDLPTT